MNFTTQAQALQEELTGWRRTLHQHPEVGMQLPHTTAFVMERLREMGYAPEELPHGGVTALAGDPGKGKTVLLRADMDALPIQEESGLPFASRCEGAAHCCGHDLHTTALLGAAKLLKEAEASLPGAVKLMFQPAEEIMRGAKSMIDDGILENPKVDAAVMLHMVAQIPSGVLLYGSGTVAASSNVFSITVEGKGGHGARPFEAIDPINAACHIHLALQELISRETDAMNPAVLTIGAFHAGTAENIIPSSAVLRGTLRTFDKEVRDFLLSRLRDVCELTARAFRATATVTLESSTPPLIADERAVDIVGRVFTQRFGQKAILRQSVMSGSEDFAEIADRVPSVCFLLGGGSEEEGCLYGIHHPKVRFVEDCLPVGAAAYAEAAHALLPEL